MRWRLAQEERGCADQHRGEEFGGRTEEKEDGRGLHGGTVLPVPIGWAGEATRRQESEERQKAENGRKAEGLK